MENALHFLPFCQEGGKNRLLATERARENASQATVTLHHTLSVRLTFDG